MSLPAPAAFEALSYVRDGHVLTVTLNRPERRNALNRRAYAEIENAFRHASDDPEVRAVVLTGADPAFCAGEDMKEMMTGAGRLTTLASLSTVRPRPTAAAMAVLECEKPVIAAINGPAMGWGLELALYADIRIASDRASFGMVFVRRGLVTDVGGTWRLPRLVGPQKAAELLFTGDTIDAAEAARIGLVLRTVPHAALLDDAQALAARIAANPPLAVRTIKEGLRRAQTASLQEHGEWTSRALGLLFQTEDHKEGLASFLEKRAPLFKGR